MSDQSSDAPSSNIGLIGAILSPVFLGLAPIFGKLAFLGGSDPFTVAAVRTVVATALLWIIYVLFWRRYLYIFPAGLLGCVAIGVVNGIGSLFYYSGLYRLDASLTQILNVTYLVFVVLLINLSGQRNIRQLLPGFFLAAIGVILVLAGISGQIDWLSIGLIMGNAILFAGTVVLSQRVLYEMPAPTLALYVLTTMAAVVVIARIIYRVEWIPQSTEATWAMIALGGSTALARLTLFMGVKGLGGLQTALLSIFELAITLVLTLLLLHEQLSALQWIGVLLLVATVFVLRYRPRKPMVASLP
ncbi:MAG: DMT family transporter [Chloroflexota bacterium]